jgi:DNA-binding CsgD family transcriptional regulator/PAS domain-containing protein
MLPAHLFSELLQTLYAATLDEAQWPVFLSQLCQLTDSRVALFLLNDSTLGNRTLAAGGVAIPEKVERRYKEQYSYTDPYRQAFMRNPRVGIIEGEDLVPEQKLLESPDYASLVLGRSLQHMTCLVLSITPRTHEIITLWRGPGNPRLEADHHELLTLLFPHLQNAVRIRRTLGLAEDRARNAEGMLDASATVSILLNAHGQIVYMNRAAQTLALAADGFLVRNDRVVLADRSRRHEFDHLVQQCAAAELQHPGGAILVERSARSGPLQFLVTPLRVAGGNEPSPRESGTRESMVRVLVLATDPAQAITFPDAILRQLYALTPAETEVANGLLTGYSLDEIAHLRRVSVQTVRSQMKSLLAKTETSRQGDLIRLLSTLPRTVPAQLEKKLTYPN